MSGDDSATPPPVIWAQRPTTVFLTICLEDCVNPTIEIKPDSVVFAGVGGVEKKPHKLTIQLYNEINPEKSVHAVRDRMIEFVLKKKEEGPFWPRLTKEKVKYHWLKVDFNKWRDEDDSGDERDNYQQDDIETMMKEMAGLQGGDGMGKANMDDLNVDEEEDSDDGDLPDLE